jgi:AP-4 complex subunit epsilon-1
MLLYCSMNLTHVNPGELAFALPQAVNLAEMGQTLRDKQLGMVFVILEPWIYVNNKQL